MLKTKKLYIYGCVDVCLSNWENHPIHWVPSLSDEGLGLEVRLPWGRGEDAVPCLGVHPCCFLVAPPPHPPPLGTSCDSFYYCSLKPCLPLNTVSCFLYSLCLLLFIFYSLSWEISLQACLIYSRAVAPLTESIHPFACSATPEVLNSSRKF